MEKKTYTVFVHERWVQTFEVVATSPENAREKVARGFGVAVDNSLEYVEQIGDSEDWTVEEK